MMLITTSCCGSVGTGGTPVSSPMSADGALGSIFGAALTGSGVSVRMYGAHQRFRGRISGFTMGTGSTLALLPAENATGNFVKVVQRLPVRIELLDYDPDVTPLFIGLSVTPYVRVNEEPTGPDAGRMLQASISGTAGH